MNLFAPGGTARIGASASGTRSVLDETNFPSIDLSAIKFLQGSFHVWVLPELYDPLVLAALISVCIRYLTSLTHVVWNESMTQWLDKIVEQVYRNRQFTKITISKMPKVGMKLKLWLSFLPNYIYAFSKCIYPNPHTKEEQSFHQRANNSTARFIRQQY